MIHKAFTLAIVFPLNRNYKLFSVLKNQLTEKSYGLLFPRGFIPGPGQRYGNPPGQ
jgi:hypothetical protein